MGSCFSKCKPKRKNQEECNNNVQDKMVIISSPPLSSTSNSNNKPLSPTSNSSDSSFSCTNSNTSISISSKPSLSSSSSSCSSSIISSKERTFSNEFLWSCVKENPHVVLQIDPIKGSLQKPVVPIKSHAQKLDSPAKPSVVTLKHSIDSNLPIRQVGSTNQKRARTNANSPTHMRQKSLRREPEWPNSAYSLPSRALRSPSPSRRFGGDSFRGGVTSTYKESYCKRSVVSKGNTVNSGLSSVKKESLRPASPNNNSSRNRACLMNREMCTYRIGSKIDEIAVGEVLSSHDNINDIHMEDIDNPLIALDCFIFL